MVRVRYTAVLLGPWFIIAIIAGLGAGAIFLVANAIPGVMPSLRPGRPPVVFVILWLAAFGWNAYLWLFRIAWRLELDGDVLKWQTPLRHGQSLAEDIRSIGPHPLSEQVSVISRESLPRIYILTRSGFNQFAEELMKVAPAASYRENSYAVQRAKRTRQWASGFRKIS